MGCSKRGAPSRSRRGRLPPASLRCAPATSPRSPRPGGTETRPWAQTTAPIEHALIWAVLDLCTIVGSIRLMHHLRCNICNIAIYRTHRWLPTAEMHELHSRWVNWALWFVAPAQQCVPLTDGSQEAATTRFNANTCIPANLKVAGICSR